MSKSLLASPSPPMATRPKVQGRTVVITGGSQGSGRATALLFAKNGYNVVVVARQTERLQLVAKECSDISGLADSSLAVSTDITDEESVAALVKETTAKFESVDVVVNNAGVCLTGPVEDTSMQDYQQQMAVNFFGAVSVTRAFLPLLKAAAQRYDTTLRQPRPSLVIVNSFGGRLPLKHMSAYTASKFALAGWTDAVRAELEPKGINVSQIHPGVVRSNFLERAQWRGEVGEKQSKFMESLVSQKPSAVSMVQTPEDVAAAVFKAYSSGTREVMVGLPFKAAYSVYNTTGFNMFAI